MKLIEEKISLNQPGSVTIIPEEPDDLWLLYNLVVPGDIIVADTTRKVNHTTDSGKSKSSARVKLKLEIKIATIDYEKDSSIIRVKGKTVSSNQHVSAGAFHTVEIEKNKQFDLNKKRWDSDAIDSLHEGCNRVSGADLAVILMQETFARVYLIGTKVTTLCENINGGLTAVKKNGSNKFFENVFRAFVKHIDFEAVKCVVIGSPGSIKDKFRQFLLSEAQKLKMKTIEDNKSRIVSVVTGSKISLKEVLHDDVVMNVIKDTKAAMEIRAFKEFLDMLTSDSDRVCYGSKSVEAAQELQAIETLLITDDLFKSAEIKTRHKYVELVKSVKEAGGNAFIYSSSHVSGEQLATLTGIAAILRFPLPDLDDMVL